jgi:hypothetical protein
MKWWVWVVVAAVVAAAVFIGGNNTSIKRQMAKVRKAKELKRQQQKSV